MASPPGGAGATGRRQPSLGALAAVGLGLFGQLGCGYHFAATGGPLPGGVKAVDVPVLRNQTTEPGLEGQLTDEIRRRLAQLGYGGEATERATLVGTLVAASGTPLAPKVANSGSGFGVYNPGLYSVTLVVNAKLQRGAELLWQADGISLSERYLPADDLATLEANRRQALHRLVHDLAHEVVERLSAGL